MTIQARFLVEREDFTLDIDLTVPDRGVTALFGPSGCGKTTLLRAMAGLDRHPSGIMVLGDEVWQRDRDFLPVHRRPLGYVFQESSLFPHLTVRGNLAYGEKRVPRDERKVSVDEAIDLLGIESLLDRMPDRLSGGERQRVAMARALAASPRLLLMDEPLASLDRERKLEILPFLETLHRELACPVMYVSHAADEVARLADHLVLLEEGRVQSTGEAADLLSRMDLPLAHDRDACVLIEARVASHDETYHLTRLDSRVGPVTVVRSEAPVGRAVRLRVVARDVSLALAPPERTSIRNMFAGVVEAIEPEGPGLVLVRVLVGETPILSRITRLSAEELALTPGTDVYVQIKSVALLG